MQRMKFYKWPTRNPGGDVLRTKLVLRTSWNPVMEAGNNSFAMVPTNENLPLRINDLYRLTTFGSWADGGQESRSSASFQAAVLFRRYRCDGIAITAYPTKTFIGTPPEYDQSIKDMLWYTPYCFNIRADSDTMNITSPGLINYLPTIVQESRWGRSWILPNPQASRPRRCRVYYSTKKVYGPLKYAKTDLDFTGLTDFSDNSGFASTGGPIEGPVFRMSLSRADSSVPTLPTGYSINWNVTLVFTMYVTYFDRLPNAATE